MLKIPDLCQQNYRHVAGSQRGGYWPGSGWLLSVIGAPTEWHRHVQQPDGRRQLHGGAGCELPTPLERLLHGAGHRAPRLRRWRLSEPIQSVPLGRHRPRYEKHCTFQQAHSTSHKSVSVSFDTWDQLTWFLRWSGDVIFHLRFYCGMRLIKWCRLKI